MVCCVILTHLPLVPHIYASTNRVNIGLDNGLSPFRCQAIIWANAEILLTGPWGTNFNEILIEIHTFSFKEKHLKMSFGKWRPFCLGLNVFWRKRKYETTGIMASKRPSDCWLPNSPRLNSITSIWTEWSPFCRRHFEMHYQRVLFWFFELHRLWYVRWGVIDNVGIGSCNGFAPDRRQGITWTNNDSDHWRIYAALWEDALTPFLAWWRHAMDRCPHYWPFVGESTGHRRIPITDCQ